MKSEKIMETILYGMLTAVFTMAFFFGMLFPEYGLVEKKEPLNISYMGSVMCVTDMNQRKQLEKEQEVVYASYFYDCFCHMCDN